MKTVLILVIGCINLIQCKEVPIERASPELRHCPAIDCAPRGPLVCTEPYFKVFNGVRCTMCPRIVPCKPQPRCPPVCAIFCPFGNVLDVNRCPICKCKTGCRNEILPHPTASCDSVSKSCPSKYVCNIPTSRKDHGVCCLSPCEKGTPLKNVRCGLGGQTCPNGYYCNEDVCCQIPCKRGKPHPTRSCADIPGALGCPAGYSCLVHPADAYAVCCPNKNGRHPLY